MNKSRILVLSNMYPTKDFPSYGVFVKNVCVDFIRRGVDVKVIAIKGKPVRVWEKICAYLSFYVRALGYLFFTRRTVYLHFVAHTSLPLFLVSLFRKLKVIAHVHGSDVMQADHMHGLGSKVKFKISQRGLKLASLVVVPSEYFRLYVHQQYAIDDINIVVSPSGGVDTDSFAPTKKTQTSSYISLGYVGRLDAGKGVDTLLNAMALLKDKSHYRLDIIGSGELELTLKNKVEQLALQNIVCFKGVLAHHELPDFLNVFDYLVFPTQLNESLGLVGLEAMACGVPIITTGLAGVSDYFVDGENGIGFSAGNEEELATVIDKLSEVDVAGYKVLQTNARNMAERFDQKKVNADLLAAINQVR